MPQWGNCDPHPTFPPRTVTALVVPCSTRLSRLEANRVRKAVYNFVSPVKVGERFRMDNGNEIQVVRIYSHRRPYRYIDVRTRELYEYDLGCADNWEIVTLRRTPPKKSDGTLYRLVTKIR